MVTVAILGTPKGIWQVCSSPAMWPLWVGQEGVPGWGRGVVGLTLPAISQPLSKAAWPYSETLASEPAKKPLTIIAGEKMFSWVLLLCKVFQAAQDS